MNRRRFLVGGVGVVAAANVVGLVKPARAQQFSSAPLISALNSPIERELWALRLDAIWFPLVSTFEQDAIRSAGSTQAAFDSYYPWRMRLLDQNAVAAVATALQNSDTQGRVESAVQQRVQPQLPALSGRLADAGINPESRIATEGAQAIIIYSQFLEAQSSDNSGWLCQVYGLRLIFC